eukprot:snap_masked-scaffold_7-processed-gene-5.21-mRNA-1 protein AED:0.03 eAED:0.05 QI:0/0/0/0.5/1/1/2/0/656
MVLAYVEIQTLFRKRCPEKLSDSETVVMNKENKYLLSQIKHKPKKSKFRINAKPRKGKELWDTYGKMKRTGEIGPSTYFVSRQKAMKMLQLTPTDFRKLCILKGIYPRQGVSPKQKQNTYYHRKDIAFLSHEPLLQHFRNLKAHLKKVDNKINRKDKVEAKRRYELRPTHGLDHLVKERYPKFEGTLNDLDDCLSLIYLFSNLSSEEVHGEVSQRCLRLTKFWEFLVCKGEFLEKVFASVKGMYFSARIMDNRITWLVPHKFKQNVPEIVDLSIMEVFLDFYMTMIEFVMYKLYFDLNLVYPPTINKGKEENGEHLAAVEATVEVNPVSSEKADDKLQKEVTKFTNSLSTSADNAVQEDETDEDQEPKSKPLLYGLVFFLSREVPKETLDFCISSCGGRVLERVDSRVTHYVCDRDAVPKTAKGISCEFVQPQWVFDSINSEILLPIERYKTSSRNLPPHLSPFVDDTKIGYVPAYRSELNELQAASGKEGVSVEGLVHGEVDQGNVEKQLNASAAAEDLEDEDSESSEEEDLIDVESEVSSEDEVKNIPERKVHGFIEARKYNGHKRGFIFKVGSHGVGYYEDLAREITFVRNMPKKKGNRQKKDTRGTKVMTKKSKRLYDHIKEKQRKEQEKIDNLKRKRKEIEKRTGQAKKKK